MKMKSKIKKTRFNEFLLVRRIDSIIEFKKDLWWDENDYRFFKKSATQEINAIMQKNKSMSWKDSMRLLYQPSHVIMYNEQKYTIIFCLFLFFLFIIFFKKYGMKS